MTNGEMIQKVFDCEVCEPIPEDDNVIVVFSDKNDSAIGFDLSWWNMECKEVNKILKALDAKIKTMDSKTAYGAGVRSGIGYCKSIIS